MTASETGHIVFSTLHTINAGQTINRILGMYAKRKSNSCVSGSPIHSATL